jgi:hypothetical protein
MNKTDTKATTPAQIRATKKTPHPKGTIVGTDGAGRAIARADGHGGIDRVPADR